MHLVKSITFIHNELVGMVATSCIYPYQFILACCLFLFACREVNSYTVIKLTTEWLRYGGYDRVFFVVFFFVVDVVIFFFGIRD